MQQKSNKELSELRSQYFSNGVGSVSLNFIESAQGAILRDVEGKEYIDFAGGIGTMSVGHSHPLVVEAIKKQADKLRGKKHTDETKKKMSIAHKGGNIGSFNKNQAPWNKGMVGYHAGPNHYNWHNGASFKPYGLEFNNELKEKIRERDYYRCQQCFRHQDELFLPTGVPYKLSIHHIDYNKQNNVPSNLISLCKTCHGQTHYNRKEWIEYFQNKMTEV